MTVIPALSLEPPAARPFLPRHDLVARLAALPERLVLLCAPAGSGKSMALLAFARAEGGCHWTDAAGLGSAPRHGTLILDGMRWPDAPQMQAALMAQLRVRLREQRLFIALSQPLPQPLRDEWIAGRAALVGAEDLRFGPQEALALFGTTGAAREVQLLHQFTRGWPLGLGLLSRDAGQALALMRRNGARQPLPRSLALWFDDWLHRNLDTSAQHLLMDLSVFGEFPATLVSALPPAGPGLEADTEKLAALRDEGLFLAGHATRPGWLRLMPAFARYLSERLALNHPARAEEIRRFAVQWSASHQDAPGEMRHGLAIWSPDEAVARVDAAGAIAVSLATGPDIALAQPISAATALTAPLTFFGMIYERIRLGAFDEARVHYDNAFALTDGFTRFDTPQDADQIRDWIRVFSAVVQISADTAIDPAWRAGFDADLRRAISTDPVLAMAQATVMMLMALNAGEAGAAVSIARLSLQLQDQGRGDKAAIFVHLHHASALIASARLAEAKAAIAPAQKLAADHTYADSYEMIACQIHAGLCAFEAGEAEAAQALLEPCYDHLPRIHGWRRIWLEYFAAMAELADQARPYASEAWITRGIAFARQRHQPHLALGLELVAMDLAIRNGRAQGIAASFEALMQRLQLAESPAPQILHLALMVEIDLLLQQGDLPGAAARLAALDRGAIAAHDLRLELRVISIELILARHAGESDAMRLGLFAIVGLARRLPRLARLPLIRERVAQTRDALLTLGTDPGKDLPALEDIFPGRSRSLLSPRETQIIAMVAEGLSNKEMARALGTSEGTVKSHRKNLYEKLDVNSRSRAIARARDLGLVPGGQT